MAFNYLLILGIGHLLGDFYLQNEKIAKYKNKKYKGILLHSAEYFVAFLLIILPIFSVDMVCAATYAALAHFAIDSAKYAILKKKGIKKTYAVFLLDQFLHLASIFVLAYSMEFRNFSIGHIWIIRDVLNTYGYDAETIARWVLAILFIHKPVNIFIQNFLEEYKPNRDKILIKADNMAGRRIGTIERLIMLIFLSKNQFTALGFILTAKSITRYDKITKDEKFAEYYLLGTLLSTLCVILCKVLILV